MATSTTFASMTPTMTNIRDYHVYFREVACAMRGVLSFNPRLIHIGLGRQVFYFNDKGELDVSLSSTLYAATHS